MVEQNNIYSAQGLNVFNWVAADLPPSLFCNTDTKNTVCHRCYHLPDKAACRIQGIRCLLRPEFFPLSLLLFHCLKSCLKRCQKLSKESGIIDNGSDADNGLLAILSLDVKDSTYLGLIPLQLFDVDEQCGL